MIRPMGIFQLVDLMGIDVVQFIMSTMNSYIPEEKIHSALIDSIILMGSHGGRLPDGSQNNGFFSYKKGKITGVFDAGKKRYISLEEVAGPANEYLGALPVSWKPWKEIVCHPHKGSLMSVYFDELKEKSNPGAVMAKEYLQRYRQIGMDLVKNKVAFRFDDVNSVVMKGFLYAYGPVSPYF